MTRWKMASAHPSLVSRVSSCMNYQRGSPVLALLLCLMLILRGEARGRIDEIQTLLTFKASMALSNGQVSFLGNNWLDIGNSGGYWSYWSTWKETSDNSPCDWVGVACTNSSTVQELDLSGWVLFQLTSESMEILSNLTDLRKIDFSSNYLGTGYPYTIPDTIRTLTGLESLHLARNNFSGPIPPHISACQNLTYISIENNYFSGDLHSLRGLEHLQVLLLGNNKFSGLFPTELGEISSLVNIDLSSNMLNGTIPSLPKLTNLLDLKLDNNGFTEFDEPSFPGVTSLEHLSVSGNQLEGAIPFGIGDLQNLKVLDMSNNRFSGDIPFGFSKQMTNSLTLDLSQNQFTGRIPANLLQPQVSNNFLVSMNLSHNLFTGNIPLNGSKPYNYLSIDLSHNNLTGHLPSIHNSTRIYALCLQNNLLSGDIVDFLGDSPGLVRLMQLRLENNLFVGDLSRIANINTSFQYLQGVDLSNNNLGMSASVPSNPNSLRATLDFFSMGGYLKVFRVAGNNFSGTYLRPDFGDYSSLEMLDFSSTHLRGEISAEAFNSTTLPALRFLNLSNNDISGSVPESLIMLPALVVLDVTNNSLSGPLPYIPPNSGVYNPTFFSGNDKLCGNPLPPCPQHLRTGVQWWVVLVIVGGSVIMVVGSCLAATWRWRVYHKRHQQDADLIKTLMERESATLMSLRELKKATQNFAETAQIGEGGFGTVYIGKLNDGTTVAIKRSKREGSEKDKQQFLNEVRILSQVSHRNLVKLLGCCMENKIAVLVFEFISNGNLQEHLQGQTIGRARLSWRQRLQIAVQTADALNYLHSATTFPIYHRDVKSANILLDDNFNARVTDFGISRLAPLKATHVSTIAVKGTIGYIDPEYYTSYQLTDKSDVYSFGVVLLELISAQPAVDFLRGGEGASLVSYATPYIERGDLQQLIDPALLETFGDPTARGRESITNVTHLAMKCLDRQSKARPSMREVWKELQNLWHELEGLPKFLSSTMEEDDEEGPLFQVLL